MSSQSKNKCYDNRDDELKGDLNMLIEKLPHIRRTDPEAKLLQTFLSPEEKANFEQRCDELGMKMSHVLRCLAVQFVQEGGVND